MSFIQTYTYNPATEKVVPKGVVVLDLALNDVTAERMAEFIVKLYRSHGHPWTDHIADQIEAQVKPPRIPEPTAPGSVVIASQVGEIEGSDRTWVRFRRGPSDAWIDSLEHVRSWDDLDSPRLPGGAS